jgi:hypothetical protein
LLACPNVSDVAAPNLILLPHLKLATERVRRINAFLHRMSISVFGLFAEQTRFFHELAHFVSPHKFPHQSKFIDQIAATCRAS